MVPPLKFVGGKRRLAPLLEQYYDPARLYVEPFCGSAALFFHLEPKKAVLGDVNRALVDFYRVLKKDPRSLIGLKPLSKASQYYRLRERFNTSPNAQDFLMLNRTCFQGLWRTNKKGYFNVPYGNYESPSLPSEEVLLDAAKLLKRAKIVCRSFDKILSVVDRESFVYADPPYMNRTHNYTENGFGDDDQKELAHCLEEFRAKGGAVVATNRDCPEVRKLYPKKRWQQIEVATLRFQTGANEHAGELVLVAK
jgi:DNA adenine methylase